MKRIKNSDINFKINPKRINLKNFSMKFFTVNSQAYFFIKNQDNLVSVERPATIYDEDVIISGGTVAVDYYLPLDWSELVQIGEGVLNFRCINNIEDPFFPDMVYNQVVEDTTAYYIDSDIHIDPAEDDKNLIERVVELESNLAVETADREDADVFLSGAVDTEVARAISAETELSDRISYIESGTTEALEAEIARAISAETAIRQDLTDESEIRSSADTAMWTAVTDEITRASSAETAIDNKVDVETLRAIGVENAISGNLETYKATNNAALQAETTRATSAETALQTAIGNEATARANADSALGARIDAITGITDLITAETARATAAETALGGRIDAVSGSIDSFFDDAKYEDSGNTKVINFYNGNVVKATIDCSDFLVDGMIDDVRIETISGVTYLVIDFNTASGKEDIQIPLTDIFNPSNYYTKSETSGATEIANALAEKLAVSDFNTYSGNVATALGEKASQSTVDALSGTVIGHTADTSIHLTSGDVQSQIDSSISGKANSSDVYLKTETSGATELTTAFAAKQDQLIAGENITISGNVISATGGGGKAIEAGRGIDITTGETADTVSFNLPISAGTGTGAIIEGYHTTANGYYSHAEGYETTATKNYAHAEGYNTTASGDYSHAEGYYTRATGDCSHAEGYQTHADKFGSHAEGHETFAANNYSHAEGEYTRANGYVSHAEGYRTTASTSYTHTEGFYTKALNVSEHASGQYNVSNTGESTSAQTLFSVGNGTADNARHNAFEIRQNGDIYISSGGTDILLQDHLGGGGSITIDTTLDSGSTNPVQNQALYSELRVTSGSSTIETLLQWDAEVDEYTTTNFPAGSQQVKFNYVDDYYLVIFYDENADEVGRAAIDGQEDEITVSLTGFTNGTYSVTARNVTITYDDTDVDSLYIPSAIDAPTTYAITPGQTVDIPLKNIVDTKQDKLSAGTGISISGNVISSTASITVDSSLNNSSTNPVQNKALYDELRIEKETELTFTNDVANVTGINHIKVDLSNIGNKYLTLRFGYDDLGDVSYDYSIGVEYDSLEMEYYVETMDYMPRATYSVSGNYLIVDWSSFTSENIIALKKENDAKDYITVYATEDLSVKNQVTANTAAIASKQDILSAGTGISISGNVISATGGGSITIDPTLDSGSTNAVANSAITNAITAVNDDITELSANSITNCNNVEIVDAIPTPPSTVADNYVKVTWLDGYSQTYPVDYNDNIGDGLDHNNENARILEFGNTTTQIDSYNFLFNGDNCYLANKVIFNGDVTFDGNSLNSAYYLEGVYFYAPTPSGITTPDKEYFLNYVYDGCNTYETEDATYPVYVADLAAYSGATLYYDDLDNAVTWSEHFGNRLQEIPSEKKFVYNDFVTYSATTNAAIASKQDTLSAGTGIEISGNVISATGGGGKTVSAGTNISITTGETADTINCTLPITADTRHNYDFFTNSTTITGNNSENAIFGSNNYLDCRGALIIGGSNYVYGNGCFVHGYSNEARKLRNSLFGDRLKSTNSYEFGFGQYNNSVSASTTWGDSGNTLFSIGNGTADDARHNAFEIRQNGDIYLSSGGTDIKLQDHLGGGGASYSAGTGIDITNDVISVTGMVATSAVTTALTSSSTDAEIPTAKVVYDQMGGLKLVKLTQTQYDNLQTKDNNTLYVIVG